MFHVVLTCFVEKSNEIGKDQLFFQRKYIDDMEKLLPLDVQALKSFAVELSLANLLFYEKSKEKIFYLLNEKCENIYRRIALEKKAGIDDTETSATFISQLQKIEEENELQAATIARLKIQNHMLEQNAHAKTESFRKTLNDTTDNYLKDLSNITGEHAKREEKLLAKNAETIDKIMELKAETSKLVYAAIPKKTLQKSDLQYMESVQAENELLQRQIYQAEIELVTLNNKLELTEAF